MSSLDPHAVRAVAYVTGVGLALVAETVWSRRSWHSPRWKRLLFHGGLTAGNAILLRLAVAAPLALLAAFVHERSIGLAPLLGLRGVPEILATIVVLDLADYVWHRANHRIPFLWRFHRAHHSDTHVDVTTALRFHPGELLLSSCAKATWILAWGPSLWAFAIFELLISTSAQYHHTNIDFPDRVERVLRAIQVTPRMHASHHSARTRSLDSNFSTIFSAWDRLFGTYVVPEARHLVEQGLPWGRDRDLDPGFLLMTPFRKLGAPGRPGRPAGTADSDPS